MLILEIAVGIVLGFWVLAHIEELIPVAVGLGHILFWLVVAAVVVWFVFDAFEGVSGRDFLQGLFWFVVAALVQIGLFIAFSRASSWIRARRRDAVAESRPSGS